MKIEKRIALLIYPPTGLYDRSDRCQSYLESETGQLISPPMDLLYMAAVLQAAGYKCIVRDYPVEKRSWADVENDIKKELPSILVISTTTSTIKDDLKACDIAKSANRDCLTVGKGGYVEGGSGALLGLNPNLDIFINNEAEFAIKEISAGDRLESIKGISFRREGKVHTNPERPLDGDLDSLPLPARGLINNRLYKMPDNGKPFTSIITGRGCPFRCIYCLAGKVGGTKLRLRSVSNIVNEIADCVRSFGIKDFWFRADTFTFNKKWVIELCRSIIDNKLNIRWMTNSRVDIIDGEMLGWMKKAGCTVVGFGIESGNQELLDRMHKGITLAQAVSAVNLCRKHKIRSYLHFIIGLPWESEDTFNETIKFAKSLRADMYNFSVSYPFPGTELYNIVKENGLLRSDDDLDVFGFFEAVADTLYMKRERIGDLKAVAFRQVLLDPAFILRTALSIRSPALLGAYIREGTRLLKVIYGGKNKKG